jgi:iron(III) transport system ATP-binding protein
VTHDQEEALTLSDQIAVFNAGYIEQIGTPQEIYHHSKTEFVCTFIGDINYLDKQLIQDINNQTGSTLNPEKNSYIRTERISLVDSSFTENKAEFSTTVKDIEFYGLYAKYSLESDHGSIKLVDMVSGNKAVKIGDTLKISMNPADIMQY